MQGFNPLVLLLDPTLDLGSPPHLPYSWNHPRPGQEFTVHHVAASESFGYFACFFFPHHLLQKPVFVVPKMHQTRRVFFSTPKISYNRTAHVFFFKGIYDFFTHTHKIELYIHINIYDCKSLTEDGKFRPITIFLYLNELPDNSGVRSPRMRLGIGYYTLQDQLT